MITFYEKLAERDRGEMTNFIESAKEMSYAEFAKKAVQGKV